MSGHSYNIRNSLWVKGGSVDASVEIGSGTASLPVYIDFHANTGGGDYEARLIRYPGTNGDLCLWNTGSGVMKFGYGGVSTLALTSSQAYFSTTVSATGAIRSNNAYDPNYGAIGATVMGSTGGAGGYRLGFGMNIAFDGSNFRTGTDGASNGGSAILTNYGNGAMCFYSAPNTGASVQTYSASAIDGIERMRINPVGSVGIGTGLGGIPSQGKLYLADYNTNGGPYLVFANRGPNTGHTSSYNVGGIEATAYRDVADPAYIAAVHFQRDSYASGLSSAGSIIFKTTNTPQTDKATLTEAMRINSNQFVGINVANPVYSERFCVIASGAESAGTFVSGTGGGVLNVIGGGVNYSNGMVLRLGVESRNATNLAVFYTDTLGAVGGTALGVGSITTNGTTSTAYNTTSDYRLKTDVKDLAGSGEFIDALQPREYTWKVDSSKGIGFIAHELQAVSPLSVTGEKDAVDEEGKPVYQVVEYGSAELIAHMVAELKDLRKRVAELEAK